jgi:steroid delta-isomerase-like uncharacterized protein
MPAPDENVRRHLEQNGAYNRHDAAALAAAYAEDGELTDHALGQTFRGRDQIRAYVQQQFDGFPDDRSEVVDVISAGDWTVGRFVTVGTHTGNWAGIEPTHRQARTSVCSVVRWQDGQAVEDHIYYDLYGSLAQLGQVPPLTADA